MLKKILNYLRIKSADQMSKDGPERIKIHQNILQDKKLTRQIFEEFYNVMIKMNNFHFKDCKSNKKVELGSGTSFMKKLDNEIIKTDIVESPDLDMIIDATNMPFRNSEIKAFFGVFFFHHVQDPYKFLDEVDRCCNTDGGVILIEPYHGPLSKFIHQNIGEEQVLTQQLKGD